MQIGDWNRSGRILLALAVAAIPVAAGLWSGMSSEEPPLGTSAPARPPDLEGVTRETVSIFAGGEPEHCVFSGPDLEICIWRMPGTLYQPGGAQEPGEGVNLVCELPLDGSPGGRCSTHARSAGALPPVSADALPPVSASAPLAADVATAARLASAKTVGELSALVGDAPRECVTGYEVQTCAWHLSAEAPSRAIFAGVADGAPLEIRCTLPLDGSGRATDSCRVVSVGVSRTP